MIGIYVDDCLIIGKESSISNLIEEFKKHKFSLKIEKDVKEYLSCCIVESKDKRKSTMVQPHLLNRLIDKIGEDIEGKRMVSTPGNTKILNPEIN
jgi:flagellar biosynthesis/type III secretory pathway ATPase